MSFEGKIALVTGASRGIGRAIAETLVARGAKVIGTATSESGAQAISDYLGANGKGLLLNVTDPASIESVLGNIRAEFGEVDILVNNAGITRDNLLMRMKDDEWNDIIETNMTRALTDEQRAGTLAAVPAGRLGTPNEIASAVAFLASDEASYITGETLHVNGGMYMV